MEKRRTRAREYWELYINGCYHHPDCETCPFDDCILDSSVAITGKKSAAKRKYVQKNREKINAKSREYARKKKQEALKKEFPFLDFGGE